MVGSRSHTLHVYIRNGLGNGTLLTYHCKSKDDDLGVRTLNYDEQFKFQFKPSFFWRYNMISIVKTATGA
ncbi:hypothetical protein Lal_00027095 [Lupinus albus]|nr:hypothetical protein Lal_00027095 [Lupinus albus]